MDINAELPQQVRDQNLVTVIEKWTTIAALRDHLDSPHMHTYRKKVEDIVESVPTLRVLEEVEVQTEKDAGSVEKSIWMLVQIFVITAVYALQSLPYI